MHSRRIHGTKLFIMLPINQASQKMRPLVLLSLINFLRHLSDFKLETKYNFLSRTYRVKKSSFQMLLTSYYKNKVGLIAFHKYQLMI